MDKFMKSVGAMVLFSALIIVAAPLTCAFSAFAGLTVGWIFGDIIRETLTRMGLQAIAAIPLWKLGATLGFFASFLRTRVMHKND